MILNRYIKIVVIFIISFFLITPNVLAGSSSQTIKKFFDDADSFVTDDVDSSVHVPIKEASIKNLSKVLSGILTVIGVVIALIMIAILGINFMVQSVEEKAKIKEALTPFVIGAFVTFGAFGIWKMAISLLSGI